jgi:translation initiation factor 5B
MNYLPAKAYSWVFKGSMILMLVDFLLCIIWLPIGASRTYGFRTASEVFLQYNNGTGAPAGWNWMLCFVYTTGPIIGFDASGHVAEETKSVSRSLLSASASISSLILFSPSRNASVVASRGLFRSAVASGLCGFAATILFLFVTPDIATWSTFTSPQPFVEVYAAALGKGGCLFMTRSSYLTVTPLVHRPQD